MKHAQILRALEGRFERRRAEAIKAPYHQERDEYATGLIAGTRETFNTVLHEFNKTPAHLFAVELRIGAHREKAFIADCAGSGDDFKRGQLWGALATYDLVLDDFRELIDGVSGRGFAQEAAQQKRLKGT